MRKRLEKRGDAILVSQGVKGEGGLKTDNRKMVLLDGMSESVILRTLTRKVVS